MNLRYLDRLRIVRKPLTYDTTPKSAPAAELPVEEQAPPQKEEPSEGITLELPSLPEEIIPEAPTIEAPTPEVIPEAPTPEVIPEAPAPEVIPEAPEVPELNDAFLILNRSQYDVIRDIENGIFSTGLDSLMEFESQNRNRKKVIAAITAAKKG